MLQYFYDFFAAVKHHLKRVLTEFANSALSLLLFLLPSPFSYDYLEAKPPSFYSLKNFRRTRTERNAK